MIVSKTSARKTRKQQRIEQEKASSRTFTAIVVGVVALIGISLTLTLGASRDKPGTRPAAAEERTGTARALDVVADASTVALGHVPLNTTVTPTWTLTNSGDSTVTLGEAHAEVIDGCCPGPLQLGTDQLSPGESTELVFPLQMHPGMDGPHEFSVHLPVEAEGEKDLLELTTTGHFSG